MSGEPDCDDTESEEYAVCEGKDPPRPGEKRNAKKRRIRKREKELAMAASSSAGSAAVQKDENLDFVLKTKGNSDSTSDSTAAACEAYRVQAVDKDGKIMIFTTSTLSSTTRGTSTSMICPTVLATELLTTPALPRPPEELERVGRVRGLAWCADDGGVLRGAHFGAAEDVPLKVRSPSVRRGCFSRRMCVSARLLLGLSQRLLKLSMTSWFSSLRVQKTVSVQ